MSRPFSRPPFIPPQRPQFLATGHQGVPQDLVTDFFSTLQTGDLDKIKEYEKKNGFSFNIQDTVGKDASKKTPFHVILELDNSVVKKTAKLQILEYLDRMGSPMDAPDANNIRPIHLAVQSQDLDFIKFFIDRNVSIQKPDGQGNTPLHYAIMGKEITCPKPKKIGSLVPSQSLDKKNVNKALEEIFGELLKQFNTNAGQLLPPQPSMYTYLNYITNYIQMIPQIYDEDPIEQQLIADIHEIFATSILDKTYSGDPSSKKTAIEQIINRTYQTINDRLLRGLTKPMVITPNSGGWGPLMPIVGGQRNPINVEKILVTDLTSKAAETKRNFDTKQREILEQVAATNTSLSVRSLSNPMKEVESYMTTLLFNPENKENYVLNTEYARTVLLTLLTWNYFKLEDYAETLADKIIERYVAIDLDEMYYEMDHLVTHILDYQDKAGILVDVRPHNLTLAGNPVLTSGIRIVPVPDTANFLKSAYQANIPLIVAAGLPIANPTRNVIAAGGNSLNPLGVKTDFLLRNQLDDIIQIPGMGAVYSFKPNHPPVIPLTVTDTMVHRAFAALIRDGNTSNDPKVLQAKYSIHSKISSAIGLQWQSGSATTLHDTELNSPISSLVNIKEYEELTKSYPGLMKKYGNRNWYQILKHLIQILKPDYWVANYEDHAGIKNKVQYPAPWLFNSLEQVVDRRGTPISIPTIPNRPFDNLAGRGINPPPPPVIEHRSVGEYDLPILSQLPIYFSESDYQKKKINFERRYTVLDALMVTDWLVQYMLKYEYSINVYRGAFLIDTYDLSCAPQRCYYSIKNMNVLVDKIAKLYIGGDFPAGAPDINVALAVNLNAEPPQTKSVFGNHINSTIGDAFPEIIFLIKALHICSQRLIKGAIKEALIESINLHVVPPTTFVPVLGNPVNQNNFNMLSYFSPMTTGHFYSSLMPFFPNDTTFGKEPFKTALSNMWNADTSIVQAFKNIVKDIPSIELLLNVIRAHLPRPLDRTSNATIASNLRTYHTFFYKDNLIFAPFIYISSVNTDELSKMINHPPFVTLANAFFREISKEFIDTIKNVELPPLLAPPPPLYDQILGTLANDQVGGEIKESSYFFRVYMVQLLRLINEIPKEFDKLTLVVGDIGRFIKEELYYYIPQVFLPALIKQILVVNGNVDTNLNTVIDIVTKLLFTHKTRVDQNPNDKLLKSIFDFSTELSGKLENVFNPVYTIVESLIKLHNDVIDYLNFVSQSTILEQSYEGLSVTGKRGIFMMKLNHLTPFKLGRKNKTSIEEIKKIIETYHPPSIKEAYDLSIQDRASVYFPVRASEQQKLEANNRELMGIFVNLSTPPFDSQNQYRDIIDFRRKSPFNKDNASNYPIDYNDIIPIGLDSHIQHNIHRTATRNVVLEPFFAENPRGVRTNLPGGNWLLWDNNLSQIGYSSGMIGFLKDPVSFNYGIVERQGRYTILKESFNEHLQSVKQRIIQTVIQFVADNKTVTPWVTKVYDIIKKIGNDNNYDGVTDVQVFVVVGRLVDSIINQYIETRTRKTAAEWVLGVIKSHPQYSAFREDVENIIQLNKEPDHLNIKFLESDSTRYDVILNQPNADKLIKFFEPQIESNISEILYTTPPIDKKLIHHIFNISRFTNSPNRDGEIDSRCHVIDPRIVKKIIKLPGANIFAKNNDGNTPLHIAAMMNNAELVKLLTENNLNVAKKFKNNRDRTPLDISTENAKEHLNFMKGAGPYECLQGFITQFNDLLLSRLKDPKYEGNIIDQISSIVPIQLVMYDNMFYTFVTNYRYGFTADIKNKMRDFMRRRNITTDMTVYPTDIFKISESDLRNIINLSQLGAGIQSKLYLHNLNKDPNLFDKLSFIQTQIDGLTNELTNPNLSQDEITVINNSIAALTARKTDLDNKANDQIPKQLPGPPNDIEAYVSQYKTFTEYIINDVRERNISVVDFYKDSFIIFGDDKTTKVSIWNNFIQRSIFSTPSLIIVHLHCALATLIDEIDPKKPSITSNLDFQIIVEFLEKFADFIRHKTDLNQNLDDNTPLKEELEQIEYLINLIVTPAVYHIIIKYFLDGLIEFNNSNILSDINNRHYGDLLDQITSLTYNTDTISSYLTDKLPMKIIKHYTGIYQDGNDRDKLVTNASDLFTIVIDIFKTNKFMVIPDNSIIFTNFQQFLVPFFLNTYQNVINIARLTVHSYERYVLNTYQIASIIKSLA